MITSTKSCKKIKEKKKKRTDRRLGQMVKEKLYRQKLHKEAYTYTLTKREQGKTYIYISIYKEKKSIGATKSINISTNDSKL